MATGKRYRKKRHPLRRFIIFLLIFAAAAGGLYFTIQNLDTAQDMLEKSLYPIKYSNYVEKAASEYDLDKSLIYGVIHTESHFDENAESHAGAVGLMQVMPSSFEWLQNLRGTELAESELENPAVNIDYGCYLLKYFLDKYETEQAAVAAYNAGFVVSDWLSDNSISPDGKTLVNIPYDETAKYVEKVANAKKMYIKLYFS